MSLPKQAGAWTRPDTPRRVTAETIFDYMDGGGELYISYRFNHLDVYEYRSADASLGTILVELYWMQTSDDAFGLLSMDWGGEPIDIGDLSGRDKEHAAAPGPPAQREVPAVPPHRALYGGGLLRFWSDELYGRVLADRETPQSRAQVEAIARAIAAGRPGASRPPDIVRLVPAREEARLEPRADRTCFFRSYLVLNSAYFLASRDILGLGPAVDAVTTEYRPARPGEHPVRLIQVAYPSSDAAATAVEGFVSAYLPDVPPRSRTAGTAKVEHRWVGWAAKDRGLAVVLDAPSAKAAAGLAEVACRVGLARQ